VKDEWIGLGGIDRDQDRIRNSTSVDDRTEDILGTKWSILNETMGIPLQEQEWHIGEAFRLIRNEFKVLWVEFHAWVSLSKNDDRVDQTRMGKALELIPGPIDVVVFNLHPVCFILDGTNPEGVNANE
jgi:hypothetical protein